MKRFYCGSGRGWLVQTTDNRWLEPTTRLRALMLLREIFLIAQPLLLIQGGEFPLSAIVPAFGQQPLAKEGYICIDSGV
jgi:hypothetical protein